MLKHRIEQIQDKLKDLSSEALTAVVQIQTQDEIMIQPRPGFELTDGEPEIPSTAIAQVVWVSVLVLWFCWYPLWCFGVFNACLDRGRGGLPTFPPSRFHANSEPNTKRDRQPTLSHESLGNLLL